MSAETAKAEGPKTIHYELPQGAITVLEEILPNPGWYKDDPKQGKLLCNAKGALDALPKGAARPDPKEGETRAAFERRTEPWASKIFEFEWTDKQKESAKKCVQFYLKNGSLAGATTTTVSLIRLLGLDDE